MPAAPGNGGRTGAAMTKLARTATVTGIGVVSPAGRGAAAVFEAQCAGRSAITSPGPDHDAYGWLESAGIAAPIDPREVLAPPLDNCTDRYVLLALAAAEDAITDAALRPGDTVDPERVGLIVSSGGGALKTYERQAESRRERGRAGVSPYLAAGMLPNNATSRIAIKYGLRGYSAVVATACAAGGQSIAEGLRLIRDGLADVVVCGGADAPLHPTIAATFTNAKALARGWAEPGQSSRPFDARRNGFVLGEGACVVVLERTEHADARGAYGYADLLGWGVSTDGYHIATPRPDGSSAAACMRRAIADAGLTPADLGYINAHGTGTAAGDNAEALAIREVFGSATPPPVSATKSITGHTLGASGAVEAAVTALALGSDRLPPTANLETVGAGCELDHVTGSPRTAAIEAALSNSFGFGGHNTSLVIGAPSTRRRRQPSNQ
ncbi:beta-ketoacyl-[acyl-carrier-protein] synthase family protein [Nocardia sp. NPDC101769]|uniref:beta-ketoacyl-[acyl-carrier-protein] synthase family protein n=1 Tax=Nocardia sp. NPDC101769 TaxID=3364333 RepID=UPI003830BD14